MKDVHVHLERGEYSARWVREFLDCAAARGIEEVWFLEHTHIFREFGSLYEEMAAFNAYQGQWFRRKKENARPLSEYMDFIERMKTENFPIKVKFGLEVCYSPEHEHEIEKIAGVYPFDFLVGAVHFIDGWAFSHLRQPWRKDEMNMDALYRRYYELMCELANSGLFSGLAHPNSLQCFGAYPEGDFREAYDRIASALRRSRMYVEESSGLAINYGDTRLGMSADMLESMIEHDVPVLTASDAHVPGNTGRFVSEMQMLIEACRKERRANGQ